MALRGEWRELAFSPEQAAKVADWLATFDHITDWPNTPRVPVEAALP